VKIEDSFLARDMLDVLTGLERLNDAVGCTEIRHKISEYLVRIRLLVRDGNEDALNGGTR
jgi:hypothetical protein